MAVEIQELSKALLAAVDQLRDLTSAIHLCVQVMLLQQDYVLVLSPHDNLDLLDLLLDVNVGMHLHISLDLISELLALPILVKRHVFLFLMKVQLPL